MSLKTRLLISAQEFEKTEDPFSICAARANRQPRNYSLGTLITRDHLLHLPHLALYPCFQKSVLQIPMKEIYYNSISSIQTVSMRVLETILKKKYPEVNP